MSSDVSFFLFEITSCLTERDYTLRSQIFRFNLHIKVTKSLSVFVCVCSKGILLAAKLIWFLFTVNQLIDPEKFLGKVPSSSCNGSRL